MTTRCRMTGLAGVLLLALTLGTGAAEARCALGDPVRTDAFQRFERIVRGTYREMPGPSPDAGYAFALERARARMGQATTIDRACTLSSGSAAGGTYGTWTFSCEEGSSCPCVRKRFSLCVPGIISTSTSGVTLFGHFDGSTSRAPGPGPAAASATGATSAGTSSRARCAGARSCGRASITSARRTAMPAPVRSPTAIPTAAG